MIASRTTLTAGAILTILTAAVLAQTPARDPAAARLSGSATIDGRVVDDTQQPLRNASVTVEGDMKVTRTTVTNDAGLFSFTDLPAGRFTVTASKGGYPPMAYGAKRPYRAGAGILIADGQSARNIALTLARGGVLTGTVYDDLGQPMPKVPIMAFEVRTTLAGERTFSYATTGGASVVSDDRGVYRVFGLPPGTYAVGTAWFYDSSGLETRVASAAEMRIALQATAQSGAPLPSRATPGQLVPTFDFSAVFHPGVVDPLSATVVKLGPGEELTGMDVRMQFRPMSRIEATILDGGQPIAARISIARRSRVDGLNTTTVSSTSANGTYTTSALPPGDYTLVGWTPAEPGKPARIATSDVILNAEPVKVALNLQPAITLSVRVVFEGEALPRPDLKDVFVYAGPMTRRPAFSNNQMIRETDGTFSITSVTPGQYRITGSAGKTSASGNPAWSVRSVMVGGQDVTDLPVTLNAGDAPAATVTFGDQTSELSGQLLTQAGQPATDYFVVVLPIDRQYWSSRRLRSTRPDANGRYAIYGLPAGEYQIALTTDLEDDDLNDARALDLLASQAARVTIGYGEKKAVNLQVK